MSTDLLLCRDKKFELFTLSKAEPTFHNNRRYRDYRNEYTSRTRTAKILYIRKKIADAGTNSKLIWKALKESIGLKDKSNLIEQIIVDNVIIKDPALMANAFNTIFSTLSTSLIPNIPVTDTSFMDFLPPPNIRSFFFNPVDQYSVYAFIKSIKPKPSLDDNQLSMKLLHVVAGPISKPMAHIWNLSVAQGIFPDMWKISKSIPILKSGDSNDPLNYRIVSLINQFSKIFERIAFKRLNDFLEMNNFFSKNQFGFRKGISTAHCILSIINSISKSLNDNQLVLCVLLDIAKCFDSVNHSILLAKLNRYGIRGLANDWFRSYFSNRKQRVYVNGTPSDILCSICLGILQGSILGVILFTIFINDIGRACRELIAKLFADDCTGLISAKNLTELIPLANQELDRLLNWYNA